jgi:hypothetical protein
MLSTFDSWLYLFAKLRLKYAERRARSSLRPLQRKLRLESLEDRRVLAILTVNTTTDTHINTDGALTLREAIEVVAQGTTNGLDNYTATHQITGNLGDNDKIIFDSALNGGQILLTIANGQLNIDKTLTIDASSLAAGITIKGEDITPGSHNDGEGIRLFNITDLSGGAIPPTVTMVGMTLTHADPVVNPNTSPEGGAIRSEGILTHRKVTLSDNGADFGGGVFMAVAGGGEDERVITEY